MKSYEDAAEVLGTRVSRKIGNNTYLQRRSDGVIAVKLHATDILVFEKGKGVRYESGGWRTVTTKDRMNEHGPARISQAGGVWYVGIGPRPWDGGQPLPIFQDGMRVVGEKLIGAGKCGVTVKILRERKRIQDFAKRYMDAFEKGKVSAPGAGDCWGCLMKGKDSEGREVHMLEGGGASDPSHHIREHIRESYFVPSLLANALKAMGASQSMHWWVASWWATEKPDGTSLTEESRQNARAWNERSRVEKALRRYILQKLGHTR